MVAASGRSVGWAVGSAGGGGGRGAALDAWCWAQGLRAALLGGTEGRARLGVARSGPGEAEGPGAAPRRSGRSGRVAQWQRRCAGRSTTGGGGVGAQDESGNANWKARHLSPLLSAHACVLAAIASSPAQPGITQLSAGAAGELARVPPDLLQVRAPCCAARHCCWRLPASAAAVGCSRFAWRKHWRHRCHRLPPPPPADRSSPSPCLSPLALSQPWRP